MTLQVGDTAPSFVLRNQMMKEVNSDDLWGPKTLLVFIPFSFSGVCSDELCSIRDGMGQLEALDAKVVVITCDSHYTNSAWTEKNSFDFLILSDFWPHGEVTKAYGTFNEKFGCADRTTFVIDSAGIIREIIASDALGVAREHEAYATALAAI